MFDYIERVIDYLTEPSVKYRAETTRDKERNIKTTEYNPSENNHSKLRSALEEEVKKSGKRIKVTIR